MSKSLTICYFGIFDPQFSRNAVYIKGLEQNGVQVIVCTDHAPGFKKYLNITKQLWQIRRQIDAIVVGYSGHTVVPLAKIISLVGVGKPVIFDALCSFYESNILSRDAFKKIPGRKFWCRLIDWLANTFADIILVETKAQKWFYIQTLKVSENKCLVAYTGVNEDLFYFDPNVKKSDTFTVLFRGKFTPEAGIEHIIKAAEILEQQGENINFRIIGFGWGEVNKEIQAQVKSFQLKNLEFINRYLPIAELRHLMLESHVSLGQFADHDRLKRTIPHKAFEAAVMRLPYITAKTGPIGEVFTDGVDCLFVHPADPKDLADKILSVKNNQALGPALADMAYELYQEKLTPQILAKDLLESLTTAKVISFAKP